MEYNILNEISNSLKRNKKAALIMLTKVEGSVPREEGAMMAVFENGEFLGTIGGGKLELIVTEEALECIKNEKNKNFAYELVDDGDLHMQCGGNVRGFIKVFKPESKLLIVGGGHIGLELYKLGNILGFYTVIFDDRKDYCNSDRFPLANELKLGDIEENLRNYDINENCYVIIVTRGHKDDEAALRTVINRDAKYIGMIGSKNKTKYLMNKLEQDGISTEILNNIYAPIGINLGGRTPSEIAFSIISEILMIKNNGSLCHMKDI